MNSIMLQNTPKNWRIERLGQLFAERKEKVSDKIFPPLSVTKNGIVPQMEHVAKSDDSDNRKRVCAGDFVINSRSDRKGSSGLSKHDGSVSLISIVLEPRHDYPRFLHHLMKSNAFQEEFFRFGHGIVADLWTTRFADMKGIQVGLPDHKTQKTIANFLDRETARIDQLIEKKQRLSKLLVEKRQSNSFQLVTSGLDKSAELASTGIEWLPMVPKHWQVRRIASLFFEADEAGRDDLPVLSVSINWGISDRELDDEDRHRIANQIKDKTSYKRVRPGDLAYNMMRAWQGAFGVTKIDGLVSPAYVVARPVETIHSPYFETLLRTPTCIEEFRRASKGIADFRQRLYWEHFRQVRVVLPPIQEQIEIAAEIQTTFAKIDKVLEPIEKSIQRLQEYCSALITAAVTGQIDVTTWGKRGETDRRLDEPEQAGEHG